MTQIKRETCNHKYVNTSNCLLYFVNVSSIFILIHYISGFNIYRYMVRMGASIHIYRDEVFGDKVALVSLCGFYDKQVIIQQHSRTIVNYRDQPISDQRIQNHLELDAENEDFVAFHKFVNIRCQQAITSIYYKFSLLLLPILTQSTLVSFTIHFKLTFPTQYKAIICLLNNH